jgi:hypothetical protein
LKGQSRFIFAIHPHIQISPVSSPSPTFLSSKPWRILRSPREVLREGIREHLVTIVITNLLSMPAPLPLHPVATQILEFLLVVGLGVVVLVHTTELLPDGETIGANRHAVVLVLPPSTGAYLSSLPETPGYLASAR